MHPAPLSYELLVFSCFDTTPGKFFGEMMAYYDGPRKLNWKTWNAPLDTGTIYVNAPPRGGHYEKLVVWEPQCAPGKCVIVTNLEDGWPTLVAYTADRLESTGCIVRLGNTDTQPVFSFYFHSGGQEVRVLQLLLDNKWIFFERGSVQSFEKPECYKAKRVRDRLSRDLLTEYLRAAGFDILNPDFWQSGQDAFYAERIRWDHEA